MKNRAIIDMIEPGSTFKIVTLSGVLNEHLVHPDTTVYCENGRWEYAGKLLHDAHPIGECTVHDVLVHSSNIGAAKLALQLGENRLYNYIKLYGFGDRTGIDLPGEINGRIAPTRNWTKISITRIPMGQGVCVTPLQMVMAMGAIANGGKLMMPQIVHSITDDKDVPIAEFPPVAVRQAIDPETVKQLTSALEDVVSPRGTAQGRGGARLRGRRQDGHGAESLARRGLHDREIRGVVRRIFADEQPRTRGNGHARQRQHEAERELRRTGGRAGVLFDRRAGHALSEHRADAAHHPDRFQPERHRGGERERARLTSPRAAMQLTTLLSRTTARTVSGPTDVDITSICYDSRLAKPGALFVALHGEHVDGHDYVAQAISRGAAGVIVEHEIDPVPAGVACIEVMSTRASDAAFLAGVFYHQPSTETPDLWE